MTMFKSNIISCKQLDIISYTMTPTKDGDFRLHYPPLSTVGKYAYTLFKYRYGILILNNFLFNEKIKTKPDIHKIMIRWMKGLEGKL